MSYPEFKKLVQVIKKLRNPEVGCPWDIKQTHETLLKYLIEESYEYIHAVESHDPKKMEEELGDVLLQVVLHAEIGEESNNFNIESISKTLAEKLIRRHPHVFSLRDNDKGDKGDKSIDEDQVIANWNRIKLKEKVEQELDTKSSRRIDESYLAFPGLFSAEKIGKKSNEIGFDWENAEHVSKKVEEEWNELKEEIKRDKKNLNRDRIKEELGDLLFSMAQLARHLDLDAEAALRDANRKFVRRFIQMEKLMEDKGIVLEELTQEEMDVYWDQAKLKEKRKGKDPAY